MNSRRVHEEDGHIVWPKKNSRSFLIILLLISSTVHSGSWNLYTRMGPGLAAMHANPKIGAVIAYSRIAASFGAGARYDFLDWMALRTGLEFQLKGYFRNLSDTVLKLPDDVDALTYELQARRDFLQIPVLVTISPPLKGRIKPFAEIGAALALNIFAKDEIVLETTETSIVWDGSRPFTDEKTTTTKRSVYPLKDNRDPYRRLDVPLIVAGGISLRIKEISLTTCIRYDIGLLSFVKDPNGNKDSRYTVVYENPDSEEISAFEEHYNLASVLFGVTIPLKRKMSSG